MSGDSRRVFRNLFRPLGTIVCIATALPFVRSRAWWVRALDFPRFQVAALGLSGLGCGFVARRELSRGDRWLLGLTGSAVLAQMAQMARYTFLTPKQVVRRPPDPESSLSIVTANVRMRNREAGQMLEVVRRRNPDVVLLLETDEWWVRQMEPLYGDFPHQVKQAQDNTYGILLLSKLPLVEPEVRFLVQNDVPSVRCKVLLRDGTKTWLHCLHPRPPARCSADGEVELPGSAPRDAELVVAAMELRDLKEPLIVAGDFNDVAWSHTTRRFQRISRTLDPRVGRGMYSTWHAHNRFMRFPLDHLFVSEHFALVEFGREVDIGSDHFPLYAKLVLSSSARAVQQPPRADADDFEEAQEDVKAAVSK